LPAKPWSIVLRFFDVTLTRDRLETALATPLDRFEPTRGGSANYAQINVPEDGDIWADAASLAARLGPAVAGCVERGELGRPRADIAMSFLNDKAAAFLVIPSVVVSALAQGGFDIEVSAYLTEAD
jgi:hypothetical protein